MEEYVLDDLRPAEVVPPVQSCCHVGTFFSHLHDIPQLPSGKVALRPVKRHLESYAYNPTAACDMRSRLFHAQYRHARSQVPLDLGEHTYTHRHISLDTRCVVYAIYHRKYSDRIYVGLTYGSAWQRLKDHFSAARTFLRRPGEAHSMYNMSHQLYRIWGKYGLKDFAIMPLQVCGKPSDYRNSKEFAHKCAHIEAFWIDTLKTIQPRGYNVRNISPVHRRRNRATAATQRSHRTAVAAEAAHSTSGETLPDADPAEGVPPPPPFPPLFPDIPDSDMPFILYSAAH